MIDNNKFALGVAVILLTGLLFGKIAKFIKVPNITGYLIGGLIIGPVLINLIIPSFSGILGWDLIETLEMVTHIELGFIAFAVGSEFKMSHLKQVGITPVAIAFTESFCAVVFIMGGILLVGLIFNVPLYFAIALGAIGGATAPAATIMVIRQYRANGPLTKTLLSVVAIDDASALIFFGIAIAIVKSLINSGQGIAELIYMPFVEIFSSLGIGAVVGFMLVWFIKPFSSKGNRTILVVALILLNVGMCLWLNDLFKASFSPLLASMATGAIFTNFSNKVEDVMPLVDNITPPFVVIFFIISGASLELSKISWMGIALLLTYLVFRVAGKVFGTWAASRVCNASPLIKKWLGFGLLPQGGIAIGLSVLVMQAIPDSVDAVFNGNLIRAIVLLAVFASEVFGPILAKYALFKSGEATLLPKQAT